VKLWRKRRHLPPDGDVPQESIAELIRNWRPGPIARSLLPPGGLLVPPVALPDLARVLPAPSKPGEPLTRLERYRLMLRFNLTAAQVDRLPLDIACTGVVGADLNPWCSTTLPAAT
jgi:hypothetical protein